ncbi:nitroreductase family protein [Micromonospora sp. NPDC049051]|uniref:nitroreductase family protein n=1 Tax=Micromonospora sp. NPDC049051 TaxID=3364264 RepID=UPI00371BAACE
MPATLGLSTDELLSTTRAVRRRLDLDRPVPLDVVRECVDLALQAPSGSNLEPWCFVVVSDPVKRMAIAEIYRKAFAIYRDLPFAADKITKEDAARDAAQQRVMASVEYLAEHLHEVPMLVVPCVSTWDPGPMERLMSAAMFGSVIPAVWSFCLAARSRGLGTAWTTLHLMFEAEVAQVLDIPVDAVRQVGLLPVAYTRGEKFRPAMRRSVDHALHLDGFDPSRAPSAPPS